MLIDSHNRNVQYLRLSLTKSCPMKCLYCRPETLSHSRYSGELTCEEIKALVNHLVSMHGLKKVRLTGGEPTTRTDLLKIISAIRETKITEVSLTTNGLTLASIAKDLKNAGLDRVNVSLDTLDRISFKKITGLEGLSMVLRGLDAAQSAGLNPIKLNTVVVRGENDFELPTLVKFSSIHNYEIRFIELMPMGPLKNRWPDRFVSELEMRSTLNDLVESWTPLANSNSAARRYQVSLRDGFRSNVGFITAMSCNFCSTCDRIRIGSLGEVYPCLMDFQAGSVLPALRPHFNSEKLDGILKQSIRIKAREHGVAGPEIMTHMGG